MQTVESASAERWPAMSISEANRVLAAPGSPFEVISENQPHGELKTWRNAPRHVLELIERLRTHENSACLTLGDERISYDGLVKAVAAMARHLESEGVGAGDRVVIAMRNLPEWVVCFLSITSIGAIATPLNAWWTGEEMAFALSDSAAELAIVDQERWLRLKSRPELLGSPIRFYVARCAADSDSHERLENILGAPSEWENLADPALPSIDIEPDDPATLFYSSGTTGKPKGVLGSHRGLMANIFTQAAATARMFLRRGDPVPAPTRRTTLITVPLFHVTGCSALLIPSLYAGDHVVMMHKWDALEALTLIERERVTATGGVPTIAWQLMEHPERHRFDLSSLSRIAYGGAPASPELLRKVQQQLPQATPSTAWGMTETSGVFSSHMGQDYHFRPASCGVPPAVGEWKIMALDCSHELAIGEVGELWCKGPMVALGYWNREEETRDTFREGWLRTGDLARLDDEGFCFIVDRAKDVIIRGGENIYCAEVEHLLQEHPAINEAALVGIPDRILGEVPIACVTLFEEEAFDEKDIRTFVSQRLANFKVPAKIVHWTGPLPRNAAGKVTKNVLRDTVARTEAEASI